MKNAYIFLLSILITMFLGCTATIYDGSKAQYIKEEFNLESLKSEGLALLPVHAGAGQEGYRRPFADAINRKVDSLIPSLKFCRWQETAELLRKHNLVKSYQEAVVTHQITAIFDKKLLYEIGSGVGMRYLLFVSLESFHTLKAIASVKAFTQVWDCRESDIVWEGWGVSFSSGGKPSAYENYVSIAAEGLVRKIFNLPPTRPMFFIKQEEEDEW